MKRIASVIRLPAENYGEYLNLHANVWPKVKETIKDCHIQNYSIHYYNEQLFSYFEYTGKDYEADMSKMAADEITQKWWDICKPLQQPYEDRQPDEWWSEMKEVFYIE